MKERYRHSGYTGLSLARDVYHNCRMGKGKPAAELVTTPLMEFTEADSNAVPLLEKPLAKRETVFLRGKSQAHNYGK